MPNSTISEVKQPFVDAYATGTKLQLPAPRDVIILSQNEAGTSYGWQEAHISVTSPDNKTTIVSNFPAAAAVFTLEPSGPYAIRYYGITTSSRTVIGGTPIVSEFPFSYLYYINAVENHYPLKPPTCKEVIERILLVAEPLTYVPGKGLVKKPRYRFGYKYPLYEYPKTVKQKRDKHGGVWDEDGNPVMDGEPLKDSSGNPIPNAAGKSERKLFEKTSPEFTFTRCTLREQLQEVGKFLHAEPRLKFADAPNHGVFIYDRYGEEKYATFIRNWDLSVQPMTEHPYKSKRFTQSANTALTRVESTVENFVNRLDELGGTVTQPYRHGAISLRTDTAYIRTEDAEGSMYFPTQNPVMDVTSFTFVDVDGKVTGTAGARYDLTPYVFEKTIYDANLSSYEKQYPRSKCYALYFTQGQKHLQGFFFKNQEWSDGVFANYAILNILRAVTGIPKLEIPTETIKIDGQEVTVSQYPRLCFELTYTPIYGARLSHGKSYVGDMLKTPFALNYNQGANVVETRYYGEHVKGVAERFGNVEQTVSIAMANVNNIPEIGQKWDEEYYISAVSGAVLSDVILLDIPLTKKFNRLSEYVGSNSYKRYYEVSERMAQEREMLYRDYYVITQKEGAGIPEDCFAKKQSFGSIANTFYQSDQDINLSVSGDWVVLVKDIVSCAFIKGYTKQLNPLAPVALPAISSAFGNVMEYTWAYRDNYSAGIAISPQTEGEVSGYFGAEVPYGDYYGRMYYASLDLDTKGPYTSTKEEAMALAQALPRAERSAISDVGITTQIDISNWAYMVIDKDSREILKQSYAVEFVTDIKDIVIGSALARNNPTIGGLKPKAKAALYILQERVNSLSNDTLDLENATKVYEYAEDLEKTIGARQILVPGGDNAPYLKFNGLAATVAGKAWAIVSEPYEGDPQTVEDADGNTEVITPKYGGEVLIAQNGAFAAGEIIGKFNIVATHDIFDFIEKQED